MGAQSLLLTGGGKLTTTVTQQSMPVTFDPRLKAVGYVPYLGQIGFNAFGESQHGLDDVTLSFLAISGTADMTAPITETLRGIERLAGPREPVALAGVGHEFDRPSVMGGADDHVLVPYNGPATIPAPVVNYQGMWWNPLESGWGIDLAHQGDVIFAAWFTYDFTGAALPLTATLRKVAPGVYTGTLIRTSGPPFSAAPWVPAAVTRMEVGTATVAFANGNAVTFAFTVNDGGRTTTQTKAITRQVFRAPGTVCG